MSVASRIFTGKQLHPYSFLNKCKSFPWRTASNETKGYFWVSLSATVNLILFINPMHKALNSPANNALWAHEAPHLLYPSLNKKDWVD